MLKRHLAALNRFISRSMDECRPFFQALKKNGANFRWNEECETDFHGLKKILGCTNPAVKAFLEEMLYMYFTVSDWAMSGALVREDKGIQKPVCYVNHSMNGLQTWYQRLKKLVPTLFIVLRKLKHYFQTFSIIVLTEHPLRSVVENLEENPQATGMISKWSLEISPYGLRYEPRTAIN